eukprot:2278307-Amphidinium_carterae.2
MIHRKSSSYKALHNMCRELNVSSLQTPSKIQEQSVLWGIFALRGFLIAIRESAMTQNVNGNTNDDTQKREGIDLRSQ